MTGPSHGDADAVADARPLGRVRAPGVRLRLALAATVVTTLAVGLAGTWLVHSVEASLTDKLKDDDRARLESVRGVVASGQVPDARELAVLAGSPFVQVVVDGRVVAATQPLVGMPPLTDITMVRTAGPGIGAGGAASLGSGNLAVTSELVPGPSGEITLLAASPLDPVRRSVAAVRHGLLVSLPLLVAAVGALTWFLAGRALRPVEAMRRQVEAISAATLDRRVPEPSSGDEVARLASTMNAMLDRLEDASLRQQRFVADASHELRSPVTAIRAELEVAQRTARAGDWPVVAGRLLAEEARLEALIADLLLLATLDEGAPMPGVVAVDLAAEAVEEARRRRPAMGAVTLEVDAPDPVLVMGSRVQLRRALANLLDNAGRHARSTVRLSVRARDGWARILVDDDGPGIAAADAERVFERFTRLDDHRARDGDTGAGLGLSLVRRIAQRHDGTARVVDAPLGGARLQLELPLHRS